MQPNLNLNLDCSFCYESIPLKEEAISFSCKHNVCFQCFPFILINMISSSTKKLDWKLLKSFKNLQQCPLCSKGTCLIPIKNISEYFSKYSNNNNNENDLTQQAKKSVLCNLCLEKQATKYCSACDSKAMNSVLCDECMEQLHTISKLRPHKIVSLDNAPEHKINKNNANNLNNFNFIHKPVLENGCCYIKNKKIEFFCMSCSSALCEECSDKYHRNHNVIDIKLFHEKCDEFPKVAIKDWVGTVSSYFNLLKSAVLTQAKKDVANISQSFNVHIDSLIVMLQNIKKESQDFFLYKSNMLENKMDLIKSSIQLFSEKIEHSKLTNNQKFQMMKNFSIKSNPLLGIDQKTFKRLDIFQEDFSSMGDIAVHFKKNFSRFNTIKIEQFIETANFLQSFIEKEKSFIQSDVNINENFLSNPVELLRKRPIELGNGSFSVCFLKSSSSCSFIVNDETYLAWAGCTSCLCLFEASALIVYNLSRRNIAAELRQNIITLVSTFPKDSIRESLNPNKWLFTGDTNGVLRIYDQISLFEIHSIRTTVEQKAIISAVILEDKFNQMYHNQMYAFISLEHDQNILMYHFIDQNSHGEWEKIRTFNSLSSNYCPMINYFHDDSLSKTYIFFGFYCYFIQMYSLDEDLWENQRFQTINEVTSINFLVRPKQYNNDEFFLKKGQNHKLMIMEKFIIYTQKKSNLIIVGDIDRGTVVKHIAIPNIQFNIDLCVWNSIPRNEIIKNNKDKRSYLLVISERNDLNVINAVNFEDFSIVKTIEFNNDENPINVLKTQILMDQQYKEVIGLFNQNGTKSNIYLYC